MAFSFGEFFCLPAVFSRTGFPIHSHREQHNGAGLLRSAVRSQISGRATAGLRAAQPLPDRRTPGNGELLTGRLQQRCEPQRILAIELDDVRTVVGEQGDAVEPVSGDGDVVDAGHSGCRPPFAFMAA